MLPNELFVLHRALKGRRFYTFSGDAKLCRELEAVDELLERIRRSDNITEIHAAIDEVKGNRVSPEQRLISF